MNILKYYPSIKINKKVKKQKDKIEVPDTLIDVYNAIGKEILNIEEICKKLRCNVSDILFKLTMLEMRGAIIQLPGKFFKKL